MRSVSDFPQEALSWLDLRSDDWPIYPLKRVVESNKLALPDSTDPDYELKYVDISSVELSDGIKKTEELTFENAPSRARRIVRSGDVLVSTVRTYLRAIARVEDAPENLIASTGFAVLSPLGKLDSSYFGLFCTSHPFVEAIVAQSTGASYPATNASDIVRLPIPVPPLSLQRTIGSFVESKINEIDDLIAKKRGLLGLLAEKRSALITRAVTKGLDPTAPMKPSGIDWLGDIPAHWEIMPLRRLAKPFIGLTYSPDDVVTEGEGTLVLRASNIQGGKLAFDDNVFVNTDIPEKLRFQSGDVLVCSRNGSRHLVGKCALIETDDQDWTFGAFTTVIRSEFGRFLYWVFNSQLFQFQSGRFLTSTINQLTIGTFKSIEVPVPPKEEQGQIISTIQEGTSEIDRSMDLVTRAIDQLTEYRAAIITKAVTGELEVT